MEKEQHSTCLGEDERLYFTLYLLRHCLAELIGDLDSGQMSHNQVLAEANSLLRLAMEVMSEDDGPKSVLRHWREERLGQP